MLLDGRLITKSSLILFSFPEQSGWRPGHEEVVAYALNAREEKQDLFPSVRTWRVEKVENDSSEENALRIFLREARFGRSRASRHIGTKVSANYILSRVPRERVVIAN